MTRELDAAGRGAAFAAVTMVGVTDTALAIEATGMALLAAHQSMLAGMAGEGPDHRFVRKYALPHRRPLAARLSFRALRDLLTLLPDVSRPRTRRTDGADACVPQLRRRT